MILTIGIIFCDNDYYHVDKIINSIKRNLNNIDYEIITIDNREFSRDLDLQFIPSYSFFCNKRQFMARNKIIELAKGDYIWFLDADDIPLNMNDIVPDIFDSDIITFNYETSKGTISNYESSFICYNGNITIEMYGKYGNQLWNKFIKTELIKSISQDIEQNKEIIASEDGIIFLYSLLNGKTFKVINNIFYKQNIGFSNNEKINTTSIIENITYGLKEALTILRRLLCKNEVLYNEIRLEQLKYYFSKTLFMNNNIEIMNFLFSKLKENFFIEEIKDVWFNFLLPQVENKFFYETIIKSLENTFNGERFYNIITYKVGKYNFETREIEEIEVSEEEKLIFLD